MGDPSNPFLEPSPLPYRLPLFALVRPEHYREAIEAGMREQRAEVEAIAADPAPPTFENTLVALERSGALLRRVLPVFANASSADTNEAIDALEAELAPRLAAHRDAIRLDPRLFARIGDAARRCATSSGSIPTRRTCSSAMHREAVLAGAALDPADRERLGALNERLSTLTTAFQQHLLADTNDLALHLTDAAELDGLDDGARSAAREAARSRGLDGWLITLVLPTGQPALAEPRRTRTCATACSRHRGRADAAAARTTRGRRCSRSCASAPSAPACSGSRTTRPRSPPARPRAPPRPSPGLLGELAPPAMRNVARERAELAARAAATGAREPVAADWAFLAEQVRAERHDLDLVAAAPVLRARARARRRRVPRRAPAVRPAVRAARDDLVGYHPDTRVFEVFEDDGTPVGLYLLDPYTRDSKRGGAWMSSLVEQSELERRPAGGREQPERPEARGRRADAPHARRGRDALPRVRPRAARPARPGALSVAGGHERLPRLRRAAEPGERAVDAPARGARELRGAPRDGRADAAGARRRLIAARGFNAGFETAEYLAAAVARPGVAPASAPTTT